MSRCVIVGAGDLFPGDLPDRLDGDLWIAADGGIDRLSAAGIVPDVFLGDLDSSAAAPDGVESVILPTEKDDTDTVAAVKLGFDRGYKDFLILGGLGGGRLSHTVANLQLLSYVKARGGRAVLRSGGVSATSLAAGESATVSCKGYFSLFAAGDAAVVSVSGARFSGENIALTHSFPIGVSNETADTASVAVKSGEAYLITDA